MRVARSNSKLRGLVIAGTNAVLLGWDMALATIKTDKVLGFGIKRTRKRDGEMIWMRSMKTFSSVLPDPALGELVSTREHPLQAFQWADYSVAPSESYTYEVVPMQGTPKTLNAGEALKFTVKTEEIECGKHAIFFNRGAIASQEYARRFQNRDPEEVGQAAFDWLSRGLVEGIEAFIAQAKAGDHLHGAFFEFKNERIYDALMAAKNRGAKIKILYDGKSQQQGNEKAMQGQGVAGFSSPRSNPGSFAHNKFLIFSKGNKPSAVLTGSTNLSPNGLFGHSNNVHVARDAALAKQFLQYWEVLKQDLTKSPTATQVISFNDDPNDPPAKGMTAVFSPRKNLAVLDQYAELAAGAKRGLFGTFAFGMHQSFVNAYDQSDSCLRYALMEKKGNGRTMAAQSAEIDRIRKLPNVTIAVGNFLKLNTFDRWLAERSKVTDEAHVLYVHTKYMLIDPMSDDPIVIVGSANFSKASTDTNDENMLVIRGEKAVADVYMTEYMRLFTHYAFRESISFNVISGESAAAKAKRLAQSQKRKHLIEDTGWAFGGQERNYFTPGTDRFLRRLYFSGQ
jgi:phosphatidylserine/phosphatidylglycerophosphate/cardiolipin synthase-like enzyme